MVTRFLISCVLSPLIPALYRWLPAFLFGLFVSAGGSSLAAEATVQHLSTHRDHPTLPMRAHILIETDTPHGVEAHVTLVFPHSGYEVTDWGEPERDGHHFTADVSIIMPHEIVLPVVTKVTHVYRLGDLLPGDYEFELTSAGHVLAGKKFTVEEDSDDPDPFPAKASVRVKVDADGFARAKAVVLFEEPGYRIRDWGTPMRRGHFFSIHAEAVRVDAEDSPREERLLEARHLYRLWPSPLDPGEYELQFFINGHELAQTGFRVHEEKGSVALHVEPLTEPKRESHPLRVVYRHPRGIDTDSLGDRNIRVRGPNGYDRFAALKDWAPLNDEGAHQDHESDEPPTAVSVTYLVHAPGLYWTYHDNGSYGVHLLENSVRTAAGDFFAARRLGGFRVNLPREPEPRPWIEFRSVEIVEISDSEGRESAEETVYGAKVSVLVPATNVAVDWGGLHQEGTRFRVDLEAFYIAEGGSQVITTRIHTYRLGALTPGEYVFGVHAYGRMIGQKRFSIDPQVLPGARLLSRDIVEANREPHLFQGRYRSPHGMNPDSIREAEIRVRGPQQYSEIADLLAIDTFETEDGNRFTQASYSVAPPRFGWIPHYNGSFGVFVPGETIHDKAGNFLPGGRVGDFHVMIRPGRPPEGPRLDLEVTVDDDGVAHTHLTFLPGNRGWAVTHWGEHVHTKGLTFVSRAEIDENGSVLPVVFEHTYRLGRLDPGIYGFVWYGSNGYVSRHVFRIGDEAPAPPYERWRRLVEDRAAEGGEPTDEESGGTNFLRYAFALDPDELPGRGLLRAEVERGAEGKHRLLITRPEALLATDIAYRVEVSRDLREWVDATELVVDRELRLAPDGTYRRTVEIAEEEGETPYRFARVRAYLRDGYDAAGN